MIKDAVRRIVVGDIVRVEEFSWVKWEDQSLARQTRITAEFEEDFEDSRLMRVCVSPLLFE